MTITDIFSYAAFVFDKDTICKCDLESCNNKAVEGLPPDILNLVWDLNTDTGCNLCRKHVKEFKQDWKELFKKGIKMAMNGDLAKSGNPFFM